MEFWGFDRKLDSPGMKLGLHGPAGAGGAGGGDLAKTGIVAGAALLGTYMMTEASKENAKTAKDAAIGIATAQGDAKVGEARAIADARKAEALAFADARKTEAVERTDARRSEAMERTDALTHISNNQLSAVRDNNQTAQFAIQAGSRDFLAEVTHMTTIATAALETKEQIAKKDAEVRVAEIKSHERTAEGEQRVALREVDARIAEANRPDSVGTDNFIV